MLDEFVKVKKVVRIEVVRKGLEASVGLREMFKDKCCLAQRLRSIHRRNEVCSRGWFYSF